MAGNDTFNGVNDGAGANNISTLTAADKIDGGAGVDALSITATANTTADALNGALITNVETVNVRALSAVALDASQIVGLTAVNANLSTATLTLTNVANTTAVGVIGNGTVVTGNLAATYVATATAPVLNLSGGTNGGNVSVTAGGATSFTVNSTGAANTIGALAAPGSATSTMTVNAATNLTTGAITTLVKQITVTGAATLVTLGAQTDANLTTIDASAMTTGGIKDTVVATLTSLKGGQGADTITTGTITTTTAGSIDGGAGVDTLVVAAGADVSSAALGAQYVNFETLQVGAFSVDASLISGITAVKLGGAASSVTNLSAAQAAAITVLATDAGATIALKDATGTADVATIALQNATVAAAATVINATTLTLNGFETLNVAANSGLQSIYSTGTTLGTIDSVSFTAATSLKAINVTGAYAADVNVNGTAAKVATIDASANTAGVTIEVGGQTQATTITGTAASDVVTIVTSAGALGSYVINTGAGVDTIIGAAADIAAATINGGAGIDTLTINNTTLTVADNTFTNVTGIEKIVFSAATQVTDVVGGYANAIATANGGVLDIKAAALTDAGVSSFDASGLGAGNSLKLAATVLTGTHGGSLAITGSAGADNITVVSAVVANNETITITATSGTAVKTIDLSGVTVAGAVTVTTGAGADVIKVAGVAGTYTGGAGADAFTAGAAVDTFAYGINTSVAGAAGVNMDTITNFTTATDKIQLLQGATGVGSLLGLTLVAGTTTAAAMGTVVTDATSVATIADVYAQLAVDLLNTTNAFAGSTGAATGIVAREVTFTTGAAAGTYLVINDSTASFQAANDIVIKLVGTTTFAAGDITVV